MASHELRGEVRAVVVESRMTRDGGTPAPAPIRSCVYRSHARSPSAESPTVLLPMRHCPIIVALTVGITLGCARRPAPAGEPAPREPVAWSEIAALPMPPAPFRATYGPDSLHFGELRLPATPPPTGGYPIAVIIHGGCWQAAYAVDHIAHVAAALTRDGVATWAIEYRRVGDPGGGWPGTFDDVTRGVAHVAALAATHRLDLTRRVLVGHSAGGQLAIRAAGAPPLLAAGPSVPALPPLRGVVALAPITDLRSYGAARGSCNVAVPLLLGGSPVDVPERYAAVSPAELPVPAVPLRLIHGSRDPIVPVAQSTLFAARGRAAGGDVQVAIVDGAGHFDLIAPFAPAWTAVRQAVLALVAP